TPSRDEPPAPYVVQIDEPEEKREIPDEPPPVEFPLPDEVEDPKPSPAVVADVSVEVIEEDESEPGVKTVDETGTSIVIEPAPEETPVTEPAPEETPAAESGYVIQLGAFRVEENARRFAAEARQIDSRVFVEQKEGLWRVRVGPVESRVEAIELREKFDLAGHSSIVVEVTH
ncbi:MAG: SPOR domain-containing protein, partial [Thermoanaerobaculia bacterium]|nr:SPOR domain-containing protein [Thermoanaerobaculia bacterium]